MILASAYDVFFTITNNDVLVPDGKFYSIKGRYIDLVLQGYDKRSFARDLVPGDKDSQAIFLSVLKREQGSLPVIADELTVYTYLIGIIYFILGYYTIWIRVFIIFISILSVYLLFRVAKRIFGDLAANLFLILALFLPAQFGYSITMSRDFLRVFIVSLIIYVTYNMGDIWIRKLR